MGLQRLESVTIIRSTFVFVDLAEDMVAEFSAKGFEFVERVEIEQGFVDVDKLVG